MLGYEKSPDYEGGPSKRFDWLRAVLLLVAILAGIFWLNHAAQAQDNKIVGRASVVDGDTIEIHGTRIRVWGIDAPESSQTCRSEDGAQQRVGQRASLALANFTTDKTVSCVVQSKDRYKRAIAICSADSVDLSRMMVTNGWAWAFTRYSTDYVGEEQDARAQRVNIWSLTCAAPWDWRKAQRKS